VASNIHIRRSLGFGHYDEAARQAIGMRMFGMAATASYPGPKDGDATLGNDVQVRLAAHALAELASRPSEKETLPRV